MNITVLYGTESGNSELIAEDLGSKLRETIEQVEVRHDPGPETGNDFQARESARQRLIEIGTARNAPRLLA